MIMGRHKKDGTRAKGIQGKNGYLYIIIPQTIIENGVKKYKHKWIATRLPDTSLNVEKASGMRFKMLNRDASVAIDYNTTMSDYIDHFLDKKKREVADTSYSAYFYKGRTIKEYFRNIKVREINERMVEKFLDDLFITRSLQPRTVKDIKVLFGNIMEQALKDGLIVCNPVKEVVINKALANKYAKDKTADDDFFSYDEAQLFLDKTQDHELYILFYLTVFFGLRREEVLGLRWSAINFKDKTMRICHTVTVGTTVNRNNTTKTQSSDREYPLTDEQTEIFRQIKKKENYYKKLFGREYIENDYIFKHQDGSLYYPDYPSKAFGKLIKKIPELPQNVTFHGLRKSCVSILVHEGLDVKSIQKWVGHADIDTTLKIYAKVKDKDSKREVLNTMTNVLTVSNNLAGA